MADGDETIESIKSTFFDEIGPMMLPGFEPSMTLEGRESLPDARDRKRIFYGTGRARWFENDPQRFVRS